MVFIRPGDRVVFMQQGTLTAMIRNDTQGWVIFKWFQHAFDDNV